MTFFDSHRRILSIFSLVLFLVLVFVMIFPYERYFLPHLKDISYLIDDADFVVPNFLKQHDISFPQEFQGRVLTSFEGTESVEGAFQFDRSLFFDGGQSIQLLAYGDQGGHATVLLSDPLQSFQGISFRFYVQNADALSDVIVTLQDKKNQKYTARIGTGFVSKQWRRLWFSSQHFSSPLLGDPKDIVSVSFEIDAFPEDRARVHVDTLAVEDGPDFASSWNVLNKNSLSLERHGEERFFVFQDSPSETSVFYEGVPAFVNGSITAQVSSFSRGSFCGLSLQSQREPEGHGIFFMTNGPGNSSWRLLISASSRWNPIDTGVVDDWIFQLNEPVWMRLVSYNGTVGLFLGKTQEQLTFIGAYRNPYELAGFPGVVSLDQSKCRYQNLSVHYDPL